MRGRARGHTRQMNEPVSLRTKLQAILDAGLKQPPFPYSKVPSEYPLEIGDVPMLAHQPAGDHRARQQRIDAWIRDVDAVWKRLSKKV